MVWFLQCRGNGLIVTLWSFCMPSSGFYILPPEVVRYYVIPSEKLHVCPSVPSWFPNDNFSTDWWIICLLPLWWGYAQFLACLSVRLSLSLLAQLFAYHWIKYYKTWYVARTSYVVVIIRKFWSPNFCRSYTPLNLEICQKSS